MPNTELALELSILALRNADAHVVEAAARLADMRGRPDIAKRLRDMVEARTL